MTSRLVPRFDHTRPPGVLPRLGGDLGSTAWSTCGAAAGRLQCQPDTYTDSVTTMQFLTEQHGLQAEPLAATCKGHHYREGSCLH